MMHKSSREHNIKHNRSALNPEIIDKNYLEPNYANLVIKIIYKLWHNCSSHGHNNNRSKIEHNRLELTAAKQQKYKWTPLSICKAVAEGPVGQVLARLLFQCKTKLRKQIMNKSSY